MKPCYHCGYDFDHNPETCRVMAEEKKEKKIKILRGPRNNPGAGHIGISRENILKLEKYLKGVK